MDRTRRGGHFNDTLGADCEAVMAVEDRHQRHVVAEVVEVLVGGDGHRIGADARFEHALARRLARHQVGFGHALRDGTFVIERGQVADVVAHVLHSQYGVASRTLTEWLK